MPELPEVETIVRGLKEVLPGRTVQRAMLSAPDLYRTGSGPIRRLCGGRVISVERLGKALLIRLRMAKGPQRALVVHLGMTGRFVVPAPEIRRESLVRKHRHGRIVFEDGGEIWYVDPRRFGYIFVGGMDGLRETLNIGPDPFEIRPRSLAATLGHRSAPVKSLLLNQKLIAGLGNIYVDEALFGARVHPMTPGSVAAQDAAELLTVIRRVLRRAINHRGTTLRDYRTLDGDTGSFQMRLSAYGREGEPCRRCGTKIERIVLGGRGTHFCPRCQPLKKKRLKKQSRGKVRAPTTP